MNTEITVRSAIDQKSFFGKMKHLFASPKSVVGEMLQNARRAGATQIWVDYDDETQTVSFSDDGCGIKDFQMLLHFCQSGWTSDEVILSDKPFGMGFFSAFFAAKQVAVYSLGYKLQACAEDIMESRELDVKKDDRTRGPVLVKTRIELQQVDESLGSNGSKGFRGILLDWVKGFPLPVFFNGEELARPHAQDRLPGHITDIGFVSVLGVDRGDGIPESLGSYHSKYYLQGLPLGRSDHGYDHAIVHLDSVQFIAKMPDRSHLYDHESQQIRIENALKQYVAQHLIDQKQKLDPKAFVLKYWKSAKAYGVDHLLNDIPWFPRKIVCNVSAVSVSGSAEDVYTNPYIFDQTSDLISRSAVMGGEFQVFIDSPNASDDDNWSAALLRAMHQENIGEVSSSDLPKGHWLFDLAAKAEDLRFEAKVVNPAEKSVNFCWQNHSADIRFADEVHLTIRSIAGPAYSQCVILKDGWVMLPKGRLLDNGLQIEPVYSHWYEYDCYLLGNTYNSGVSHPVHALAEFKDEGEDYREEWESDAIDAWDAQLGLLRSDPMATVLARQLSDLRCTVGSDHWSEMAVVSVSRRWRENYENPEQPGQYISHSWEVAKMEEKLESVAQNLRAQGVEVQAHQLEAAMAAVFNPGRAINGPQAVQHAQLITEDGSEEG